MGDKLNRRSKVSNKYIKFWAATLGLLGEIGIYWILWANIYNPLMSRFLWWKGVLLVVCVYTLLLFFFQQMYGGLKIGYLRGSNIVYSQLLAITLTNGISYLQNCLMEAKVLPVSGFALIELLQCGFVLLWTLIFQKVYAALFPPRRLLLVHGSRPAFQLMDKINTRDDKYILAAAIHASQGLDVIIESARNYDAIVLGDIPSGERNRFLKACFQNDIRCYTVPKISDILMRTSEELHIFDSPLYLSRNEGLNPEQELGKRIEDILIAGTGILLFSPLYLMIALLVKLEDGGSILYKQNRLTKDGREFQIYKFRTMRMNAEAESGPVLASEQDIRITRVGRVLRACRMDELPQLFNILHGEMSVVGPRPERPELAHRIQEEMPEFAYRLKVKAGLTGYAQIYGKYNTDAYDKLKLDLSYIREYSVLLDLKLILLTIKILFMKESTEGVSRQ